MKHDLIELRELEWFRERSREQSAEAQPERLVYGNRGAPLLDSGSSPDRVGNVETEDGSRGSDDPTDDDPEESA